jgi:hypothetical protein
MDADHEHLEAVRTALSEAGYCGDGYLPPLVTRALREAGVRARADAEAVIAATAAELPDNLLGAVPERVRALRVANDVLRACCEAVEKRIVQQRAELTRMQEAAHRRNRQLDALHLVWCSGGCSGGMHRWTLAEVTAELVAEAKRNTDRLETWYINHAGRPTPLLGTLRDRWDAARLRVARAVRRLREREVERLRAENMGLRAELDRVRPLPPKP